MEVMDASLDKFYQNIYKNGERIPEEVLGKIAFSVSHKLTLVYWVWLWDILCFIFFMYSAVPL